MSNLMAQRGSTELRDSLRSERRGVPEGCLCLFGVLEVRGTSSFGVPLELRETDDEYILCVEVPGITHGGMQVACDGQTVIITGERRDDGPGSVRYTERRYGSFSRSVTMPTAIETGAVRAWYVDGVIEIRLPKARKTLTRSEL